jgi:hypothetical protein
MKFNIEKATQVLLRGGGSEFMQDSGTSKFSSRLNDLRFAIGTPCFSIGTRSFLSIRHRGIRPCHTFAHSNEATRCIILYSREGNYYPMRGRHAPFTSASTACLRL